MEMLTKLAWRNLWRNARRSGLAMGTIVMGVAMIVIFTAIMDGIYVQLVRRAVRSQTGHVQIHRSGFHGEPKVEDFLTSPGEIEKVIDTLPHVEAHSRRTYSFAFLAAYAKAKSGEPLPFVRRPWTAGFPRQAILPKPAAQALGVKIGDHVIVKVLGADQTALEVPHIGLVAYDVIGIRPENELVLIAENPEQMPESGRAVLWKTLKESKPVQVMGVEPERETKVTTLDQDVEEGRWLAATKPGQAPELVVGDVLARMMGVGVGDYVVFPFMAEWAYGPPDERPIDTRFAFRITGLLSTGLPEVDRSLVIADIDEVARRAHLIAPHPEDRGEPLVHEIAILLDEVQAADKVVAELKTKMPVLKTPRVEQNAEAAALLRRLAAQEAALREQGSDDDEEIVPIDRENTAWEESDEPEKAAAPPPVPPDQVQQQTIETEVLGWEKLLPGIVQLLKLNQEFLAMLMMIMYIIVGVGITNTILMAVMERIREFGIMLGVGMRPSRLVRLVLTEAFFLSVIGGLIGVAVGAAVSLYGARNGFDLSSFEGAAAAAAVMKLDPVLIPHVSPQGLFVAPILAVIVTVLAALYPGYKAAAFDPIESIRHQ